MGPDMHDYKKVEVVDDVGELYSCLFVIMFGFCMGLLGVWWLT